MFVAIFPIVCNALVHYFVPLALLDIINQQVHVFPVRFYLIVWLVQIVQIALYVLQVMLEHQMGHVHNVLGYPLIVFHVPVFLAQIAQQVIF